MGESLCNFHLTIHPFSSEHEASNPINFPFYFGQGKKHSWRHKEAHEGLREAEEHVGVSVQNVAFSQRFRGGDERLV